MKVEEIRVLKVDVHEDFHVLIVPDGDIRILYLCHNVIGIVEHMFSCNVGTDDVAIKLATDNAEKYMGKWRFELEEEE